MPSRGEQLVRGAQAAARAAPSRFIAISKTKPCSLVLTHCWEELVAAQPPLTPTTLAAAKEGEWFAICDRNDFVSNWRKSIIVRERESFVLFDNYGNLRDEPSAGVPNGRQQIEGLLSEFDVSGELWYRPPKHGRRTPRSSVTPPDRASRSSSAHREPSCEDDGASDAQPSGAAVQPHQDTASTVITEPQPTDAQLDGLEELERVHQSIENRIAVTCVRKQ